MTFVQCGHLLVECKGSYLPLHASCPIREIAREQHAFNLFSAHLQALDKALATPFDKSTAHPAALMTQRYSLPGRKVIPVPVLRIWGMLADEPGLCVVIPWCEDPSCSLGLERCKGA